MTTIGATLAVPLDRGRRAERRALWLLAGVALLLAIAGGFLPDLGTARSSANRSADAANLQQLHGWLALQRQTGRMPTEGGHRLLLQLWTSGVIERTPRNLDRFFTPGRERDLHWRELRERLVHGEAIWRDLAGTSSRDTHYAALATPYLGSLFDPRQPIAADDCEDGWPFADPQVNVLYGDGTVRQLELKELPVIGPSSSVPALRQLER